MLGLATSVSSEGEHRRNGTGLKMINSVFHVGFGVSVTVDNFYSYIYAY